MKDERTTAIADLKITRKFNITDSKLLWPSEVYTSNKWRFKNSYFPRNQDVAAVEEKKVEIISEIHGLFKAERCRIKTGSKNTFFSTNNGVLKLSATVPLGQLRSRFNLDLCNRYGVLKEDGKDIPLHQNDKKHLDLADPMFIKSANADVGCGLKKARKKLERRKQNTREGKHVLAAEELLAESLLNNASTISDLLNTAKQQHNPHKLFALTMTQPSKLCC